MEISSDSFISLKQPFVSIRLRLSLLFLKYNTMKRRLLHTLLALVLFQGCIKEDSSKCPISELLLRFEYTLNDDYSNLLESQINRLVVYVFDNDGKFVNRFVSGDNEITNDYVMRIPLPKGDYKVVVYGGDFNSYSVGELNKLSQLDKTLKKGVTDIADFRMELNSVGGAENYLYPAMTPDDLYVGHDMKLNSTFDNQDIATVNLIKITKKIKVKISGIDLVGAPIDIYITASNGRYNHDSSIDIDHGTFKYTPINTLSKPNYLEVDLKIMRLMLEQSPMLVVRNSVTGEIIYSENMISQILKTQAYTKQEDFDREDEFIFEIPITLKDNNLSVSVSINGWNISDINADM